MAKIAKSQKKLIYLLDDGWRYEKEELLRFMKARCEFEIVTHDPETVRVLTPDYAVRLLPIISIKHTLRYKLRMFFAADLDTYLLKFTQILRYYDSGWPIKILMRIRDGVGRLGLRRRSYVDVLGSLYATSDEYDDLLESASALLFSPVALLDKRLIFEAKRRGVKLINWVYSWDNPFKDNEFISFADAYLVWNEENQRDIQRLYGVANDKFEIVGPVQFDYLLECHNRPSKPPEERYVLFAFTMGYSFHIEQEIQIVRMLRKLLDAVDPLVMLYVRPYPFCDSEDPYADLKAVPKIKVLDYGTQHGGRIYMNERDLTERYEQIQQAECFVNLGSTIVLEASFTTTPIIQLNFTLPSTQPWYHDIGMVMKNDHLKYILNYELPNIVSDECQLKQGLKRVLNGNCDSYMEYSARLQSFATPLSTESYKTVFLERLNAINQMQHCPQ